VHLYFRHPQGPQFIPESHTECWLEASRAHRLQELGIGPLKEFGHFSSFSLPSPAPSLPSKRRPASVGERPWLINLAPANPRKAAPHWMRPSMWRLCGSLRETVPCDARRDSTWGLRFASAIQTAFPSRRRGPARQQAERGQEQHRHEGDSQAPG
jgi:hypothetical protein